MSSSTGSSLTIRPMGEDDIPQVREIDRVSFSMPWSESAYRHEIADESRSLALVAEAEKQERASQEEGPQTRGAQIVGLLVVWLIVDEAHIATIAVHPDFRNSGISRILLAVGLKSSIKRGARSATLEVRVSNQAAQNLYRSFYFKLVGRRNRYYRDNNEDALIMSRDLLALENYPGGYLGWLQDGGWLKKSDEYHTAGRKIFDNIDLSKVE
jgi:ribosomal-protein-alanine N-acetyltransferase